MGIQYMAQIVIEINLQNVTHVSKVIIKIEEIYVKKMYVYVILEKQPPVKNARHTMRSDVTILNVFQDIITQKIENVKVFLQKI